MAGACSPGELEQNAPVRSQATRKLNVTQSLVLAETQLDTIVAAHRILMN